MEAQAILLNAPFSQHTHTVWLYIKCYTCAHNMWLVLYLYEITSLIYRINIISRVYAYVLVHVCKIWYSSGHLTRSLIAIFLNISLILQINLN